MLSIAPPRSRPEGCAPISATRDPPRRTISAGASPKPRVATAARGTLPPSGVWIRSSARSCRLLRCSSVARTPDVELAIALGELGGGRAEHPRSHRVRHLPDGKPETRHPVAVELDSDFRSALPPLLVHLADRGQSAQTPAHLTRDLVQRCEVVAPYLDLDGRGHCEEARLFDAERNSGEPRQRGGKPLRDPGLIHVYILQSDAEGGRMPFLIARAAERGADPPHAHTGKDFFHAIDVIRQAFRLPRKRFHPLERGARRGLQLGDQLPLIHFRDQLETELGKEKEREQKDRARGPPEPARAA